MFELILCSSLTILPDYLFRRFVQGKRFGREITLYTMFYELRWGITTCIILTVLLITVILYNHPSTTSVLSLYRTVPVVPEINGRVAAVYVKTSQEVTKDTPLFKLDDSKQQAAVEVAKRQIAETDAAILAAKTDLATDDAKIQQATGEYNQAVDELNTKQTLYRRNPDVVARRDLERLQRTVEARRGALNAAIATKKTDEVKLAQVLPADRASAQAALEQAQVELRKTLIKAGVDGRVEQFLLRPGDIVNPLMRPAGILIPAESGRGRLQAGFGQIESQVMKVWRPK